MDVYFVLVGKVVKPFILVDDFYPLALSHVVGEGVGNRAKVGQCAAPDILGIGRLPSTVGMEGCFD